MILQLEHGDDSFAFCVAKKGQRIKIKRKQYAVDCIIGATYGSCFEIEGKSLKRAKSDGSGNDAVDNKLIVPEQTNIKAAGAITSTAAKADTATETSNKVSRDNRDLIDDNSAQKLQQKEIGAPEKWRYDWGRNYQETSREQFHFSHKNRVFPSKIFEKKKAKVHPTYASYKTLCPILDLLHVCQKCTEGIESTPGCSLDAAFQCECLFM